MFPDETEIKDKTYKLIKTYGNYALYQDDKGIRKCFDKFDLELIPKSTERIKKKVNQQIILRRKINNEY